MGIHDRPYYRDPPGQRPGIPGFGGGFGGRPGSPGGIPHPRTWSVRIWLVVINTAIFVLGAFPPLNQPASLAIGQARVAEVDDATFDASTPLPSIASRDATGAINIPRVVPVRSQDEFAAIEPALRGIDPDLGPYRVVGADIQFNNGMGFLSAHGHFSTMQGFVRLGVWRLLTFQFLHADFLHLALNMFGLVIFGGMVEQYLGKKRFLAFYLASGIAGALLYLLLNGAGYLGIPLPGALSVSVNTPLVGASAGVFAVIVAAAKIAPNQSVYLLFLPVALKLKFVAYGYVALAALNLFFLKGANQGGDAAHVGGAVAGYFLIRHTHLLNDFFDVFGRSKSRSKPRPGSPRPAKSRAAPKPPKPDEVDRILAKVSTDGLQSLTDKEKKILRNASKNAR